MAKGARPVLFSLFAIRYSSGKVAQSDEENRVFGTAEAVADG
jgi:hypothetical protein